MATVKDVTEAVERIANVSERYNWTPARVTHVAKQAYSITFLRYDGDEPLPDAIRAISDIQHEINKRGWENDPLVLVFPIGMYRINVFAPLWAKLGRRRVTEIRGIPVRRYSKADKRIVEVLERELKGEEGVISNTVQETLAAYAWKLAKNIQHVARNVEITVPTPYPDPIRTRVRALRDYGITIVEIDALGLRKNRVVAMEAKAASGGKRRWENIVRRKMGTYKAIPRYLGRTVTADFVVTSNNANVAVQYARKTRREVKKLRPFAGGSVIAAWARNAVRWREIE